MKNNISLEHSNVLLRIFFVSGVFQNFEVDFWPLLMAEKVLPPNRFWREFFFPKNFIFYLPYKRYKLLASRITENSAHCYTLIMSTKSPIEFVFWHCEFTKVLV